MTRSTKHAPGRQCPVVGSLVLAPHHPPRIKPRGTQALAVCGHSAAHWPARGRAGAGPRAELSPLSPSLLGQWPRHLAWTVRCLHSGTAGVPHAQASQVPRPSQWRPRELAKALAVALWLSFVRNRCVGNVFLNNSTHGPLANGLWRWASLAPHHPVTSERNARGREALPSSSRGCGPVYYFLSSYN